MIVEWNGKTYQRRGECNNCGECCTGWVNPCPQFKILPDSTSRCGIYEKRAERNDPEVLSTCGVMTTACAEWPKDPGDLIPVHVRNRCTYYFVEVAKILVACPTHASKEYAWKEWVGRVKSLTHPRYDILVADNSPDGSFYERHKTEVPMIRVDGDPRPEMWLDRICKSMAAIQDFFLAGDYSHWMNIEADVIPPVDVVETLMKYGHDADWASHCYQSRAGSTMQQGIGCSLLSRRLIADFDWKRASDSPDAELWNFVRQRPGIYKTVELWDVMRVEHLHG